MSMLEAEAKAVLVPALERTSTINLKLSSSGGRKLKDAPGECEKEALKDPPW